LLGGEDPLTGSLRNLAQDAIEELPTAIERSEQNDEE